MKIAFLGMGLMGSRMAKRLIEAGHKVWIWNRSSQACEPLFALGAQSLTTEALQNCDVIALCLADDHAVTQVAQQWFGQSGEHLRSGQIIVDFSSGTPQLAQLWASKLSAQGADWIDAPVSGGVQGAEAGTLVIFAGGQTAAFNRLTDVWPVLAQRATYMGESGSGQVTKLCNQLIVAASSALIAEAVTLAQTYGVDASQLAPALAGGFADSKPFQILAPRMATQTFEPVQWKVQTLLKDLDNVQALAGQLGINLSVSSQARQQLAAQAQINAEADLATLIQQYRATL